MPSIRVLVGTRKGAFICTSDKAARSGKLPGRSSAAGNLSHERVAGGPRPHLRLADQRLVRTDHFSGPTTAAKRGCSPAPRPAHRPPRRTAYPKGKATSSSTTKTPRPQTADDASVLRRTHQASMGIQTGLAFGTVIDRCPIHVTAASKTPRCSNPPTTAARNWKELADCAISRARMGARRRRHGIAHHHSRSTHPDRILRRDFLPGAFRSDDAGKTWKIATKGLKSNYMPDPTAEVGFCVHRIAHKPQTDRTGSTCNCIGT